jgi:oxygen-independent coproporphyrinogen III oxidase
MQAAASIPDDALMAKYDVAGPRYTSYPTVPNWRSDLSSDELAGRLEATGKDPDARLSVYVHLPFCKSLCWYCGCNVVIARDSGAATVYVEAIARELELVGARLGARRRAAQVHLGGGTPTFLNTAQLTRLWDLLLARFDVQPDTEIAIEVHPAVTCKEQLALLRSFGFNRISMGLQDFDPQVQRATNRIQSFETTRELTEYARALGFTGMNFDLIYGLPFQTTESWERTLDQVLSLRPDRLAVYSFAFLPEVLKHQRRMPAAALPTPRNKLELFRRAYQRLLDAGYEPIGMDHFALPGDELARARSAGTLSRNFQGYTVRAASDMLALGASGISDVQGMYAQSVRALPRYYERLQRDELPMSRGLVLSEEDLSRRRLITQLMCNFWVDLGEDAHQRYAPELKKLEPLERDGLVKTTTTRVEVTDLGRMFVRNVAMAFDQYLTPNAGLSRFSRTV